jgi:hypothetical protein
MMHMTNPDQAIDDIEMSSKEDFGEEEHGTNLEREEKSCEIGREGFGTQHMHEGRERGLEGVDVDDDVESADRGEDVIDEKKEDVPPNGGYGWVCVACVSTINAYVRSLSPFS